MSEALKDSKVTWLGKIPESWSIDRTKFHYTNLKQVVGVKSEEYERLALTLNGVIKRPKDDADGLQPGDFNGYQVLKSGDLVFKLIDLQNVSTSRVGLAHDTGIVSPAYIRLEPRRNESSRYGEYYFLSMWQREIFNQLGDAGVRSNLSSTDLLELPYIRLPYSEQIKIADFLDEKCAEIDQLSEDIQRQIDILEEYKKSVITRAVTKGLNSDAEMKDSGIDWIGQIPKSWEVLKIKNLGTARNGLTYSPNDLATEEDGTLVLRSSNVKDGKINLEDNVYVSCKIPSNLMVKKGDILICSRNGSRELIGKNAIIDDIHATYGAFMMVYRSIDPEYLYYILNSEIFSYYLGTFFTSTINQLTGQNFNNMKIVFCPDKNERVKIVEYLKEKASDIDDSIRIKKQQLDNLNTYKKSIIYEYVTGKKRVA